MATTLLWTENTINLTSVGAMCFGSSNRLSFMLYYTIKV